MICLRSPASLAKWQNNTFARPGFYPFLFSPLSFSLSPAAREKHRVCGSFAPISQNSKIIFFQLGIKVLESYDFCNVVAANLKTSDLNLFAKVQKEIVANLPPFYSLTLINDDDED